MSSFHSVYADGVQSFHKSFQPQETGSFLGRPGDGSFLPLAGLPHQKTNVVICGALFATYIALRTGITEVAPLASQEIFNKAGVGVVNQWYEPLTLPFAMIFVSDLIFSVPFSWAMQRFGRRPCFMFGGVAASLGFFLSGLTLLFAANEVARGNAIGRKYFWLLSACGLMIGPLSMAEFCRFAAAEAVPKEQQARVLGVVISGGALNAVVGPAVASLCTYLAPNREDGILLGYAYFYFTCVGFTLLFATMASFLRLPEQPKPPAAVEGAPKPGKCELLTQPGLAAAFVGSFGAQAYMVLLMTASPVAMSLCVMQLPNGGMGANWRVSGALAVHLLGMFVPGFFSGGIIAKMGARLAMNVGDAIALGAVALAMTTSFLWLDHPTRSQMENVDAIACFYIFLIPLGIGWHFSFVSASRLLLEKIEKESDKGTVQGVNEFLRFLANTISIILAGALPFTATSCVGLPIIILLCAVKNHLLSVDAKRLAAKQAGSELFLHPPESLATVQAQPFQPLSRIDSEALPPATHTDVDGDSLS